MDGDCRIVVVCGDSITCEVVDERDLMCMIEIGVAIILAILVTISLTVIYIVMCHMFIVSLLDKDWIAAVVLGAMLFWFSSLWLRILG